MAGIWLRTLVVIATIIASIVLPTAECVGEYDRITLLPDVTFKIDFNQYSGYLDGGNNGSLKVFYWLLESQSGHSAEDLLAVWIHSQRDFSRMPRPGCSGLFGMFAELGPFYVNQDGQSLYENIYGWNKRANLLFIESPIGTGFSYNADNISEVITGDDNIAKLNHDALADFFARVQPQYQNRSWYITGESYAGVYIPTLTTRVLESIQNGSFPNENFKGIAIGNGYMNVGALFDSLVYWSYYHGIIGIDQWKDLLYTCNCNTVSTINDCKFSSHVNLYNFSFPGNDKCGELATGYVPHEAADNYDPYNFYQSCYGNAADASSTKNYHALLNYQHIPGPKAARSGPLQTANYINYNSTDNQFGYPCWNGYAAHTYLNRRDVQEAIHVDETWILSETTWQSCNNDLFNSYNMTYITTNEQFDEIIQVATQTSVVPNFRVLVYNGDVDTVCNFLGDAWHLDNITKTHNFTSTDRSQWNFRQRLAGFAQTFSKPVAGSTDNFYIDVVTVKGSGHMVPNDRPGPALQMLVNFLNGTHDYSKFDPDLQLPQPAATVNGA